MSTRMTREELETQFELFLKESVSDDSVDLGSCDKQPDAQSGRISARRPAVPWWEDDDGGGSGRGDAEKTKTRFIKAKKSQPENDNGLLGSGKSFRNSMWKSQSIQEEEEEEPADSVMSPAVNLNSTGLDTLEEEEEKARFFAQLETEASSTIDYSKLNRELDSASSTRGTDLRKSEEAAEQDVDAQRKASATETVEESPAFTGSPNHGDNLEEDENAKEQQKEKSKMSQILAKVSLYDSLDGPGVEDRVKDMDGPLDRGPYVQSGGSEMEALHEAYRQIHVVEDSDDQYPSLKGRGRTNKSVSPSSPPHCVTRSLQPASTDESELPTAEELMKPIRPEMNPSRGFSLQLLSTAEQQNNAPHVLENIFPALTSPNSQLKQAGEADPETRRVSSPHAPNHNLTWSIKQEVERLMQDQDKHSSPTSSQTGNTREQQASHRCTVSHPSASSVRKPPAKSRGGEGKAAVTSTSAGPSRAAAQTTTKSSLSRPLQHPHQNSKSTKSQQKDPGLKLSGEQVASGQSAAAVHQRQTETCSHQDATDAQEGLTCHPPEDNREDGSLMNKLRVQLAQKERELRTMKDGLEELNSLRQQNYLLQSKLRGAEEASQKRRWADVSDSATKERLQQMDKEMEEQESLIKGYQQENERLYLQMKALQSTSKAAEEAMFNENQRLMNELAFTREQLNKNARPVGNICITDQTQIMTDVVQRKTFQTNEAKLSEEIHRLRKEKQILDVDLQQMKKERDLAKAQAAGERAFEMRALEERHREEVASLVNKLQWFAENQELLDRDAGRLKAATAQVQQLKEQVEKLKMGVSKRSSEKQRKAEEKAADTKRKQDLERQVKVLEQILRHRDPNSLPALMYAAATAGSQEDAEASETSAPSRLSALLECRVQHLEAELESHDEEAKCSLRAMEQQFHKVKLRYEQQISELEQQLEHKQQLEAADSATAAEPKMSPGPTLEGELQHLRRTHQEKEKSLLDQIGSLQQQLKHKAHPSPGRRQRQAEEAFSFRIERLNQELRVKTRTIQDLSRTVDRLQKERKNLLSGPHARPETRSAESRRQPGPANSPCPDAAGGTCGGGETFPAANHEKSYQPTFFTGSHISEVLQENEALKQRLEQLELQSEQDKQALKAEAAQIREELRSRQEHSEEQLSSLKAEHLRVLDQLRATHTLEHASSKVAELANKLSIQEIRVKHLQDQLRELQGTKDALAISRTREDALQKQLIRLLKELKEAKDAQNPEVKLLCSLERKILNMELRHQHREKKLQQAIIGSWQPLHIDQQSEVEHWKQAAQDKRSELEAFRLELDSILDMLRQLHKQTLPTQKS